ncbi:MAG: hypothetical protein FWE34_08180 [Defluviitaleaceae bacterium]|nr:hypothetical protein [Defluviitaleaceae bacterium]
MKRDLKSSIKYGLSAGSKIFTGITVYNMLLGFINGNVNGFSQDTLDKLVIAFVCVGSSIICDRLNVSKWLHYILSFLFTVVAIFGYITGIGYFMHDATMNEMWPQIYLDTFPSIVIISVVVAVVEEMAERANKKKQSDHKVNEEGS